MKIIITESQSKILWLRRRLGDPELMDHLKDIVIEGFDYTNPCDYGTYDSYEINVVNDSTITFFMVPLTGMKIRCSYRTI